MRFLEDDKIRLRAVEPGDADRLWEAEADSRQWLDNGMSAPFSRENLRHYASNYDADPIRSGQLRLICEKKTGETIGIADLYDISATNRTALVGIYIYEPYRLHGYAHTCLELMEIYARMLLNLRILAAKISETNKVSIKLFENSGYEHVGTLPQWLLMGRETHSLLIFSKKI